MSTVAIEINDELHAKLRAAKDAGEVAAILEAAGQQATEAEIERIVAEVQYAAEHDGEELSLDELDAVAGGGGGWRHDYTREGCVATVEYGSHCLGEDGGCTMIHNDYNGSPVNVQCTCGHWMFKDCLRETDSGTRGVLTCPYCKAHILTDTNVWFGLKSG